MAHYHGNVTLNSRSRSYRAGAQVAGVTTQLIGPINHPPHLTLRNFYFLIYFSPVAAPRLAGGSERSVARVRTFT